MQVETHQENSEFSWAVCWVAVCSVLDTGYWVLGAGGRAIDAAGAGCLVLYVPCMCLCAPIPHYFGL